MGAMLHAFVFLAVLGAANLLAPPHGVAQEVPTPREVIGFEPGEDFVLADNDELYAYYRALAEASDRVEIRVVGETARGEPMLLLFISSEENLSRLERWRQISERLARARDLTDDEARELAREGRVIVWIDSGLHSTELAHSQHAPHLAYHMATDESEETRRIRDEVVLLLMPLMNPDGHRIAVDWYRDQRGTPFETAEPPEIYSEYTGHDNNRDWFMVLQAESQNVARILYEEWYPQIVFNHHQTGPFPARITIPPFAEPVNPNIPPQVVRGVNLIGSHMADRFEEEGMPGVISHIAYDMWWNGGMRTSPYFHNQLGILAEVQHSSPTPRFVAPEDVPATIERRAVVVSATEPSIFYPNPWPGGWLTIGESVQYHLTASLATLDIASLRRERFLYNFYQMGRDQIAAGEAGGPYAYIVAADQRDPYEAVELLNVLRRGGVEVNEATSSFQADGRVYPAGSHIIYAAQAFRAHVIDLMEPHVYPERAMYPGGPPEPPYDLAGWTLPIQMGVQVARIEEPFTAPTRPITGRVPVREGSAGGSAGYGYLLSPRSNAAAVAINRLLAAGDAVARVTRPFEAVGTSFDSGTFIVENGSGTSARVAELACGLGLDFVGIDAAPDLDAAPLREPRIGIYRSWVPNIPEGWLRWILDHYEFRPENLWDGDIRERDLSGFDIIILPAQDPAELLHGHEPGSMPDAFVGGLGADGFRALQRYVREGGRLLAIDGAVDAVVDQLGLPVRSALEGVSQEDFFIPGSLLRIHPEPDHPLTYGMPRDAVGTFVTRRGSQSRAFDIVPPADGASSPAGPVEIVIRWGEEDLLLSGWALGADHYLAGRPAAVQLREGEGNVVLLGFRAGFRGQPRNSFKLLFNSIFAGAAESLSGKLARETATAYSSASPITNPTAPVVRSPHGVVATAHPLATAVGARVLAEGGNAMDAAVTAGFALTVVEFSMSGLGGRASLRIRRPGGQIQGIDGVNAVPDQFEIRGTDGYIRAAVPGLPAALGRALDEFGTWSLERSLAPAIRFAEEGFRLDAAEAARLERAVDELRSHPGSAEHYLRADGTPYEAGERFVQPAVARVLRAMADEGVRTFYEGWVADSIHADMERSGGFITREDLAAYDARPAIPAEGEYRGFRISSNFRPASGHAVVQALHMLEEFDVPGPEAGAEWASLVGQVMRIAAQDRRLELDSEEESAAVLTSRDYALARAAEITLPGPAAADGPRLGRGAAFGVDVPPAPAVAAGHAGPGEFEEHTTHLSVIDRDGMAVALSQSLGPGLGTRVASPALGFLYATILGIEPGSRPSSTMSPTIVEDPNGELAFVLGGAGGAHIITAVVQTLSRLLDHGMALEVAMASPRVHLTSETALTVELGTGYTLVPAPGDSIAWSKAEADRLRELGFEVEPANSAAFGRIHATAYDREMGLFVGVADPRRWGSAASPVRVLDPMLESRGRPQPESGWRGDGAGEAAGATDPLPLGLRGGGH